MTARRHEQAARADFEKRAPEYTMTVGIDERTHRHLKFSINNSAVFGFNIITWPGHLAISGDMGCFVFSRLTDMFEFFRGKPGEINPAYWAEKIQATAKHEGHEEYSAARFREEIMYWLTDQDENPDVDPDLLEAVEDVVLIYEDEGESQAIRAAMEFTHDGKHVFQDFYEVSCREYTYHYLWCLHAIVWAISQYDESKAKVAA